jgi:hypothetical protein
MGYHSCFPHYVNIIDAGHFFTVHARRLKKWSAGRSARGSETVKKNAPSLIEPIAA